MRNLVVCLALLGIIGLAQAGPLDRVRPTVDKVVPEIWDISIYLKGGEVVKVEKVGLSEWGLRKRLTINAVNKTLTVVPTGQEEARKIPTADVEKIEMKKSNILPDTEVMPQPKNTSNPLRKTDSEMSVNDWYYAR